MKYSKYIVLVVIGLLLNSCQDDFLNPLPDSAIVLESFFQSDDDVLAGIYGIYDAIQGVSVSAQTNTTRANRGIQFEFMVTELRSDNTRTATLEGSRADFHRYLVNADNLQSEDYYQSMYEVIFRANNILQYVNVANESNQASYTAECKFLRAYAYFNLVRLYGDVPLLTRVAGPTEDELLFTRSPSANIYQQIEADLQEAIDVLDNSSRSRASKGAAQGLLAKVYLTKEDRDYEGAKVLCEAIMNSGDYALQDDFSDVFYDELNNELLFVVEYAFGNIQESQGYSAEFTTTQGRQDGLNILDGNLIAAFTQAGGNRTSTSFTTFSTATLIAKYLPTGTDLSAVPVFYGEFPQQAGNDWIILRYADVLLMHAEAILAGGAQTSDTGALDSYMAVRVRAGFDPITDRPTSITQADLLLERRVELAFENQRFFDLQRFGVADQILSAHAADQGFPDYNPRKLLLPIPAREINLSDGLLSQNPGY